MVHTKPPVIAEPPVASEAPDGTEYVKLLPGTPCRVPASLQQGIPSRRNLRLNTGQMTLYVVKHLPQGWAKPHQTFKVSLGHMGAYIFIKSARLFKKPETFVSKIAWEH